MIACAFCLGFIAKAITYNEKEINVNIALHTYDPNVHMLNLSAPMNS